MKRQYFDTAEGIETCQIRVFLGYANRHGQALIDRAVYLLREWIFRTPRGQEARIPETVKFTTNSSKALPRSNAPMPRASLLLESPATASMAPSARSAAGPSNSGSRIYRQRRSSG